jgi:hypothetical protein
MPWTSRTGMRCAMRAPKSTAGTFAIIMPNVVPAMTEDRAWYSDTVVIAASIIAAPRAFSVCSCRFGMTAMRHPESPVWVVHAH